MTISTGNFPKATQGKAKQGNRRKDAMPALAQAFAKPPKKSKKKC